MKIIGGKFRGRLLYTPKNRFIRPTNSLTKKAIFDILSHVYPDALNSTTRMLDIFAGTGSIGFEALSRGCFYVLFVDNNVDSMRLIRRNSELLGIKESCGALCRNALNLGKIGSNQEPFQFLYLDPPYGQGLAKNVLDIIDKGGWLEYNALVIVEEYAGIDIDVQSSFKFLQRRRYGDTQICFFYYQSI